jgi:ATP-binding cassette subfamily B protein
MKKLLRLAKEAKGYRAYLITAGLLVLILTALSLIGPRIQTIIISYMDKGLTDESLKKVVSLSLWLLGVYLIRAVFRFAQNIIAHIAAWNIVQNIRIKLYNKMQTFTSQYFSSAKTGDLMSRVVNDTATFEQLYAHIIPESITNLLTFIGVAVMLFSMNPGLALLTCIPIPIILLGGIWFSKKINPWFKEAQASLSGINTVLQDSFAGIQEIRSFGQEERQAVKVSFQIKRYTTAILNGLYRSSAFHPSVEFMTSLGTVIVMSVGACLSYKGQLSISYIVGFLLYLGLFFAPITGLTQLLEQAQQALAGAERVLEIIDTPVEIYDSTDAVVLENAQGYISFKDVSFRYVQDKPVLYNISFDIKPGQFVAIVGPTGVGKTTMVKLASRLYDPTEGVITLDGYDLRRLSLISLRKALAYVPQDTFLFNCTIAENIAFGKPEASREEIIKAAKIARIHDDIMEMPEGYDTMAGERGIKLSGGQKQRIAIARAVICGAPVLILDEATSSVDAETEQLIQRSIDELTGSHTVIAIAHRLSTIKNADLILVIEEGSLVQCGTHEQLMEREGLYSRMYKLQTEKERIIAEEQILKI